MVWLGKQQCCLQKIHCKYKDISSLKVHSSKYVMVAHKEGYYVAIKKNDIIIYGYENVYKTY